MDWENEPYVRLYTRETIADLALSWEAEAVWHKLMKKLDRAGCLDLGRTGFRGLAGLLRIPLRVVEPAMDELLVDGRVEVSEDGVTLVAPNFMEAQEAKSSDRQRQRDSRARRRAKALRSKEPLMLGTGDVSQIVTDDGCDQNDPSGPPNPDSRDSSSHNVTKHPQSVTGSGPHGQNTPEMSPLASLASVADLEELADQTFPDTPPPLASLHLADELGAHLRDRDPGSHLVSKARWPLTREEWAREFQELLTHDRRKPAELLDVLRWLRSDDWFSSKVLSPKQFRRFLSEMVAQRKGSAQKAAGGSARRPKKPMTVEELRREIDSE